MIVQAQTISSIVRDRLSHAALMGSVHSAFPGTVNILCGGSAAADTWVSIHAPDVAMHPHAVVLCAGGGGPEPGLLGASAGERARLTAAGIVLGGGRVTVRLGGAVPWAPALEPLEGTLETRGACPVETIVESLRGKRIASPFLRPAPDAGGVEGDLIRKCHAIKQDLGAAWRHGDAAGAARAMMSAVGLGVGLTPSGDDFLVGFLGAAHFFAYGDNMRNGTMRSLGIERSMTTLPSFFMLKGALAGFLPEPLSCMLRVLAGGSRPQVRRCALRLTALGATSGQDMLAGVICYLEAAATAGEAK
jgi:hypothetical protein